MSTYVIGDIHGCFDQFTKLLKKINYKKDEDKLILLGDLVNRGPDSLSVINHCMADSNIITVLGNHDLYLLYLLSIDKATGSLKEVVEADSNKQIFKWLLKMPLMLEIVDEFTGNSFLIAHAGIPEIWSPEKTKELASEVTSLLQKNPLKVLQSMWGDNPNQWNEELVYDERCRIIINYLTRMRFVDKNCKLDLKNNTVKASAGFKPWFKYSSKVHEEKKQYYVFGHWAALNGQTDDPHFIGLDTGCVWKGKLTALRLNDLKKYRWTSNMEIFQVGGSVRDELMGVQPKDRDWVVINSSPEEMEKNGFKPIGRDFPVFLHPNTNEEYALARTEKKSGVGYKGFEFYFDSNVTLEQDLKRRDFTINSIAKDKNGNIIDPFYGQLDIEKKIFRHTSSAFIEDPLRVIRFARFKSYNQLCDFELCSETIDCFKKVVNAGELKELSPQRVWIETKKALENKHSDRFFDAIIKYQLIDPWFKKLNQVSCDGSSPELKWADIQRINDFQLSDLLPIPNSFQKTQDLLRQVLDFFRSKKIQERLELIEKMNIHRNIEILEEIKNYKCLQNNKNYLEEIFKSVLDIDFSCLANIPASEVSQKKQFLYHETLKGIL